MIWEYAQVRNPSRQEAYRSLSYAIGNQIRWLTVNVESPSIKIQTVARPLHDAIAPMVRDFIDVVKETFPGSKSKQRAHWIGDCLPSITRACPWAKYSDTTITYGSSGERLRPTVVFKVGASEPRENLTSDASQLLLAGREAQLIVLIDIQDPGGLFSVTDRQMDSVTDSNSLC